MKLVIIVTALAPYRIALYEELSRLGNDVTVFSMMHHVKETREWDLSRRRFGFVHAILPGFVIPRRQWAFPLAVNFGVIPTLYRANPDIVISTGGFSLANIASFAYSKLWRKKFVNWCEFTLEDGSRKFWLKRLIRNLLSRYADGCIASSSPSKEAFKHFGANPDKVKIILLPVEVASFHGRAMAYRESADYPVKRRQYPGRVMIAVGRLDDAKGYPELFKIFDRVISTRPDVTLLIAGSGPKRQEYENHVRQKGWTRVHFLGFLEQDELIKHMALSDFFVFPTLNDSFGVVIAEAMASGLPVASSIHAYGTHDLVESGVNGFPIDPMNAESASETLLHMVDMSRSELKSMGQRGYEKIRSHDCKSAAAEASAYFSQFTTA